MAEVLIHNRDDLRPGDVLRVWPQGKRDRWAEGPIYKDANDGLCVGGWIVRWGHGEWVTDRFDLAEYPARRTVPDLPTEAGSAILVTALDGARLPEPTSAMIGRSGRWFVIGYGWHDPEFITGWIPLAVTEAGPEVTR